MRICDVCGVLMDNGYVIDGGSGAFYWDENGEFKNTGAYFCSDECLHTQFTHEEWIELYDDGYSQSYWTEWEISDSEDICYYECNKVGYIDFLNLEGEWVDDRISVNEEIFKQHLTKKLKRLPTNDDLEFFLKNLTTYNANRYREWVRYYEKKDDHLYFFDLKSDNPKARVRIEQEWLKCHCEVNNLNYDEFIASLTAEKVYDISNDKLTRLSK